MPGCATESRESRLRYCPGELLAPPVLIAFFRGGRIAGEQAGWRHRVQLIAGFGWSSLPWLRFLPQPTLVMTGIDDPLVPVANGSILASLIPDARLVTIDDGHLFLVTSAGKSAKIISQFLD